MILLLFIRIYREIDLCKEIHKIYIKNISDLFVTVVVLIRPIFILIVALDVVTK